VEECENSFFKKRSALPEAWRGIGKSLVRNFKKRYSTAQKKIMIPRGIREFGKKKERNSGIFTKFFHTQEQGF